MTKADRERADLVHRSHCLALLARGALFDAAASDAHVQALALSQLPDDLPLPPSSSFSGSAGVGVGSFDTQSALEGVRRLVASFRRAYRVVPPAWVGEAQLLGGGFNGRLGIRQQVMDGVASAAGMGRSTRARGR